MVHSFLDIIKQAAEQRILFLLGKRVDRVHKEAIK